MKNAHLPPHDGEIIILKTEPQKGQVSYTSEHTRRQNDFRNHYYYHYHIRSHKHQSFARHGRNA